MPRKSTRSGTDWPKRRDPVVLAACATGAPSRWPTLLAKADDRPKYHLVNAWSESDFAGRQQCFVMSGDLAWWWASVRAIRPGEGERLRGELSEFVAGAFAPLPRRDQRRWDACCLRGLMLDGRRKSIQPMAGQLPDGNMRVLQQVVNQPPWGPLPGRRRIAERLSEASAREAWVIDDAAFPERRGRTLAELGRRFGRSAATVSRTERRAQAADLALVHRCGFHRGHPSTRPGEFSAAPAPSAPATRECRPARTPRRLRGPPVGCRSGRLPAVSSPSARPLWTSTPSAFTGPSAMRVRLWRRGRNLRPEHFPTAGRKARLGTDMARAWWVWGRPEQTARALLDAYGASPGEVRDRPAIRRIVTELT